MNVVPHSYTCAPPHRHVCHVEQIRDVVQGQPGSQVVLLYVIETGPAWAAEEGRTHFYRGTQYYITETCMIKVWVKPDRSKTT